MQNKRLDSPTAGRVEVGIGLFDETGFPHRGVIDFIPERLDAGTGTESFRAVVPNPGQALLAEGMFARVQVAFSKPYPGLAVSDRAVVTNQGDKFLYVVNDKDTVEERLVELGRLIARIAARLGRVETDRPRGVFQLAESDAGDEGQTGTDRDAAATGERQVNSVISDQ